LKNAILLEVVPNEKSVQEMDHGGYITKKDAQDQFIAYLLEKGYSLVSIEESGYIFKDEQTGETVCYETRDFLGYVVYEEKTENKQEK